MKRTNELSSISGLREDGRRSEEIRTPKLTIKVLSHYLRPIMVTYTLGNTIVEVTLVGPYEPDKFVLKSNQIPVPSPTSHSGELSFCVYQTPVAPGLPMENSRTRSLTEALGRLFPIDVTANVFVHIIQADGGVLPACVAAVTCALTSGGVTIPFVLSGCELCDCGDGEILVDVTSEEARKTKAVGSCTVCVVFRWNCASDTEAKPTVCGMWMEGKMADVSLLNKFRDAAETPATTLYQQTCEQQRRYLEGKE